MDIQEVRDSIDNAELIEHIMQCNDNGYYLLELFIQWRRIIFFSDEFEECDGIVK